jgi:hypothetical protein
VRRVLGFEMGWAGALFALGVLCSGCGGDDEGGGPAPKMPEGATVALLGSDCDQMVPEFCGLPFPSNVYLADDPTGVNPNGKRVQLGATTMPPRKKDGAHFDPALLYDHDGFSPGQAPFTHFPLVTCDDTCATPYTIEKSIAIDSPTILLEVPTGRLVPHWVDPDHSSQNDGLEGRPDQRLVLIRPAEILKPGTRYIVAIRNLKNDAGEVIEPSAVFKALRAGKELSSGDQAAKWSVHARLDLYKDIFAQLDKVGVDKKSLQIAWDYTTATTENMTGRMVEMRDKALAVVGDDGPTFKLDPDRPVEESPNSETLRRIHLIMTVPLYLTNFLKYYNAKLDPGRLNINDAGELEQNGTMDWEVLVVVPNSVTSGKKHGLMQNGHGLFGSRFEGQGGYLARAANRNAYIAFAVNLFGFDEDSVPLATDGLVGGYSNLKAFTERQIQGMVNQLLVMRMMKGRIAKDGIKDAAGNYLLDPAWIDNSVRGYRGDSQGGIMGGTYMSISTDVTRGLLGEPGTPYNLLLNRSVDFAAYEILLRAGFGYNAVYTQQMLAGIQMSWDRAEPSGFVQHMSDDLLPNTPAHHVLIHAARGDHQVTTYAAHVLARAIGAKQLESDDPAQPVFDDIYGIDNAAAPLHDQSVIVEYDFGLKPNPPYNTPNKDGCDPHDRVRDLTPSFDQQDVFFRTGDVVWKCNGACNCNDAVEADPKEEDRCDPAPDPMKCN